MKIIIKKDETDKKFYDEMLFISSKYKEICKNPHLKTHSMTKIYAVYMIIFLLGLSLLTYLYLKYKNIFELVSLLFFGLMSVVAFFYMFIGFRYLRSETKSNDDRKLEINKNGVKLNRGSNFEYKIAWKDVKFVLISRYSIAFIPVNRSFLIIGVNKVNKNDIIKAIKEEKKSSLVIDNSDLYK